MPPKHSSSKKSKRQLKVNASHAMKAYWGGYHHSFYSVCTARPSRLTPKGEAPIRTEQGSRVDSDTLEARKSPVCPSRRKTIVSVNTFWRTRDNVSQAYSMADKCVRSPASMRWSTKPIPVVANRRMLLHVSGLTYAALAKLEVRGKYYFRDFSLAFWCKGSVFKCDCRQTI